MIVDAPEDGQICALVVDDDPDMRELIAKVLLEHGHLAVTAKSAEEGLAALPLYTFQVAYVDHQLPGMEGMVFGEWLRRNNPHMQIALVTGAADEDLEDMASERAIRFIRKPFDVRELLELPALYVEAARERLHGESESDEFAEAPVGLYFDDLTGFFDLPSIPSRIEERLTHRIGDALTNLHSVSRYTERDRVAALCGLLAARVLGIRLPRGRGGKTLYEEYDALMIERGRRPIFGEE